MQVLTRFSEKHSLGLNFGIHLIKDYCVEANRPKCKIACPLCGAKFSVYFTTYWNRSNYNKHLKTHFIEVPVSDLSDSHDQDSLETPISYLNDDQVDDVSD